MKKIGQLIVLMAICILISSMFSCESQPKCENPEQGKAVLVAYRVSKHSHMWLLNPETGKVHDVGGVGGRREPNINLGDTINVSYCNGRILFDKYSYVKIPVNRKTRFIYLPGYDHLY